MNSGSITSKKHLADMQGVFLFSVIALVVIVIAWNGIFNTLNFFLSTLWNQKVEQKVPSDGSFREFGTQENSHTKTRRFAPQTVGVCAYDTVFLCLQILSSRTKCSGFWGNLQTPIRYTSLPSLCIDAWFVVIVFSDSCFSYQMLEVLGKYWFIANFLSSVGINNYKST